METTEQLVQLVNDYISRRLELRALDNWMRDHLEELASRPDGDPAGDLWAFTQVRVYRMQDGFLPEEQLRSEVADYLREHPAPKQQQRAAG
jgi:hypothetical protein